MNDSKYNQLRDSLKVQISSLLYSQEVSNENTINVGSYATQKSGSQLGGYYAIESAHAVCHNVDPLVAHVCEH